MPNLPKPEGALTYHEARLAAAAGHSVQLVDRDATLQHYTFTPCWLEAGALVHVHPTDPRAAAIEAPRDGAYRLCDGEECDDDEAEVRS